MEIEMLKIFMCWLKNKHRLLFVGKCTCTSREEIWRQKCYFNQLWRDECTGSMEATLNYVRDARYVKHPALRLFLVESWYFNENRNNGSSPWSMEPFSKWDILWSYHQCHKCGVLLFHRRDTVPKESCHPRPTAQCLWCYAKSTKLSCKNSIDFYRCDSLSPLISCCPIGSSLQNELSISFDFLITVSQNNDSAEHIFTLNIAVANWRIITPDEKRERPTQLTQNSVAVSCEINDNSWHKENFKSALKSIFVLTNLRISSCQSEKEKRRRLFPPSWRWCCLET